ncbi:hypothetical protein N7481_000689 [Penicillium waksmanii]|uniref:uncharacterized protein n=1 Tax=Penicillium waksmanii TaxID=69791 RepID=UPI00254662A0|nr:uncharacterized protein N7481_000689 [Penicillium waksmanii]KAJ6000280.1 hypothetical protein N7481_000689 [Penicillium waksmanii]
MATLPVTLPVNPEFGSRERIGDHLAIMRKFKRILEDAERPGRYTHRFPPPPPGVSGQEQEGKWRVQCLLMSAEVRYSRYLQMLARWIGSHGVKTPKDEWPLPPWDVAIIFYAHLLSPFKFEIAIASDFQILWKAEIEFPLTRMRAFNTDHASKRAWMNEYPDIPYQAVEFTPAGDHAYITAENVIDIHGYRCGSKHCKKKGTYVIRMTEWSKYRVDRAKLICPGCKTTFTNRETKPIARPAALLEFSRVAFGFPVFDLWDSPQRQFGKQGLVDRILALTQVQGLIPIQGLVPDHTFRYLKFLQLMKESKSTLVPTLDIDLLWHTHQLSPVAYGKYSLLGEEDTAGLWAIRYGESYFDPENTAKNTEIERRKAACKQKREAIGTKLAAYDHSHQYIKKELDEASDRLVAKHVSLYKTQTAVSELNAAVADVETAKESVKPALRLLKLRYYRRLQRQQLQELEDKRRSLAEEYIHKLHEVVTLRLEYKVAGDQEFHYKKEWKEAQNARRLLEQRLTAEVTLATEAIGQFNVDGGDSHDDQQQQYQEDRYGGRWEGVPTDVGGYL